MTTRPEKQRKSWVTWLLTNRFTALLCCLVLLVFGTTIIRVFRATSTPLFSRLLVLACVDLMLLSAVFAISRSRRQLIVAVLLWIPAAILRVADMWLVNDHVTGCFRHKEVRSL